MHRLRSTSIGGLAGMLLAAAFFFYHLFANHVIKWEFFAIVAAWRIGRSRGAPAR